MTMLVFPFLSVSKWVLALLISLPLPVSYAVLISSERSRYPPVGKSGQGIIFISSSTLICGSFSLAITASIASPGLWGGILVVRPTAMPLAPLISKFGKRPGSRSGSLRVSSKFKLNLTVSLSMSLRSCIAALVILASV